MASPPPGYSEIYVPSDIQEFGERHGIPTFAAATYRNGYVAGYRAALAEEGEAPQPTGDTCLDGRAVTRIDILREWFGGERYARDYEYLDANYSEQANRVVTYLAYLARPKAGSDQ